jgi:Flp pilus assembly protein TadG
MSERHNHDHPGATWREQGQVLLMFALFLSVLLGALGMAIDLGMAFAERRTMQNAADAGALAGAKIVAQARTAGTSPIQSRVADIVHANAMRYGTITSIECTYVTDTGAGLGACTGAIPAAATGVRVRVVEEHPTFFIKVLPGAPERVSTGARATAHVLKLGVARDGPFLPCGINTKLAAGGTHNLLVQQNGAWVINPTAIGKTFKIHGPQIEMCNAQASRFKGLSDVVKNRTKANLPDWYNYVEGDSAGTISMDVDGPDGCKAGQVVENCVVFLPIALPTPAESGNNKELWVVAFAPFYVTAPKSNEHYGKLLTDYIVYGRGLDGNYGWSQTYSGPITIRLTA